MPTKPKYTVLVGINYPVNGTEVRAEPGDVVDNLPSGDIEWMTADGLIERAGGATGPHHQSPGSPSSSAPPSSLPTVTPTEEV